MDELKILFEGYWQCRQATDPDPTDDPRGVSGYTYAFGDEGDLDLIIRLQRDEIDPPQNYRLRNLPTYYPDAYKTAFEKSGGSIKEDEEIFGIFVTGVDLNNTPYKLGERMIGGKVRWLPAGQQIEENGNFEGPKYELRNEITYHERDGIIMPIVPFEIKIEYPKGNVFLQRFDPLDPKNPEKQIWEMNLDQYTRRNPQNFFNASAEIMEAQGFDSTSDPASQFNAYFQKRKEWLQFELSKTTDPVEQAAYKGRLFALDFFTENRRIEGKLGLQAVWDFEISGKRTLNHIEEALQLAFVPRKSWPITFWMGGFDGDVMRGYMRGTLTIPVRRK